MATITATLSATRLKSTQATGASPVVAASTTMVANLNADLLDGLHAAAFATVAHTHAAGDIASGTLLDARVAASNVTQHQAALAVAVGQLTGTVGPTQGGTGLTSYAAGDLIYASATNVLAKRAVGTNGHVLTLDTGLPVWAAPSGGLANAFADVENSAGVSQFVAAGADAIQFAAGADLSVAFDAANKRVTFAFTGSVTGITRGYADITGDSGTAAAAGADTLIVAGAGGITTAATSAPDTLTITLGNHSAALLTSGNLAYARMPTGAGTWDVSTGNALIIQSGTAKITIGGANLDVSVGIGSARFFQVRNAADNATRFSVAEATGNTVVGGTLTVSGATTHTGDVLFTDATYDIGKSGATRPRDGFFSRNVVIGGTLTQTGKATFATGFRITGDHTDRAVGDVWFASNAIRMIGGTSGFFFNKSDNSVTNLTINDDGVIQFGTATTSASTPSTHKIQIKDRAGSTFYLLATT